MNKKIIAFFFILTIIATLFIISYAHPGRTDSNGGHWDHSNGTYHYHDGSSAGKGGGGSSSNHDYDYNYSTKITEASKVTDTIDAEDTEETNKLTFGKIIKAIILTVVIWLHTLFVLYTFFALLYILIDSFLYKLFKIYIKELTWKKIRRISLVIGFIVVAPIELILIFNGM